MRDRAIIYTRVSSMAQSREDRVSLDEQAEACLAYAASKGYEVVDVVGDVASAGTVRGRPLLLEAMYRVRNKEAEILLIYCMDRLTREQAGMFVIDEEVRKGEGRIEFATEEFSDDAIGRFTRSARAFAAEIELERIAARSAMGKRSRLANNRLLVSRSPLMGYHYAGEKKGRYEVDPETAPVVRRVFAEFVGGKPINRIVTELNDEGVPTATGTGRWHKPTVWNMLRNRAYLGEAKMLRRKYGKDQNGKQTMTYRPEEETVSLPEGTIPPLIDQLTFDRAQARLERNKAELVRPITTTDALLRAGFVWCGECGYRMVITRKNDGTPFYRCQTSNRSKNQCHPHSISAPALDAAVWSRIEVILSHPERLRRVLVEPGRDLANEIAAIDSRIEELKREEAGIVRLAARLEEGDDAAEALLDQVRDVARRRKALVELRERLVAAARNEEAKASRVEATIAALESAKGVGELGYEGKRQALSDLRVKVAVYPSQHESPYRWVMWAFERRQDSWSAWADGERRSEPYSCSWPSPTRCRRWPTHWPPRRRVPRRSPTS